MNVYALSTAYGRRDFPLEVVPVPADNADRTSNNSSDKSLVVKQHQDVSATVRRRSKDEVEVSLTARDGNEYRPPPEKGPKQFLNGVPRSRDWDYRILSWFRTALSLQGTLPQDRGVHINIFA